MTNSKLVPKNPKFPKKSKIKLENFGFHVAYIGGTYRVQKSDVDDSVEGTEKAM
jgi:hypothetical protein